MVYDAKIQKNPPYAMRICRSKTEGGNTSPHFRPGRCVNKAVIPFSKLELESDLYQTLCAETHFTEQGEVARQVYIDAKRGNLHGEISFVV